jgi:hypothetical protein
MLAGVRNEAVVSALPPPRRTPESSWHATGSKPGLSFTVKLVWRHQQNHQIWLLAGHFGDRMRVYLASMHLCHFKIRQPCAIFPIIWLS